MKKILFIPTMWKRESMCKRIEKYQRRERERERDGRGLVVTDPFCVIIVPKVVDTKELYEGG